jgi:hypothetical protein
MAFHPDYAANGTFFVDYTDNDGNDVVARYHVSSNPDVADPASGVVILRVSDPFPNHNGGMLAFGPNDGYLYVSMGDGGSAFDPGNRAQNRGELLGKILRLDVDTASPYAIPPDNPFAFDPNARGEVWAYGLRNPWRPAFDRVTGDFYIADVGQNEIEEIDFQPGSSAGGENYGWRCMEGTQCTGETGCTCNAPGLELPIFEYSHDTGGCAVIGGYPYRGGSIPLLAGTYFFSDNCTSKITSFRYDGTNLTELADRTAELDPPGSQTIDAVTSFGEDAFGEMYVIDGGGEVFKLVTAMKLATSALRAGQSLTLQVSGATANQTVSFVYSTTGTGATFVPSLGVTLALRNPTLAGRARADAAGNATLVKPIPAGAAGTNLWLQAVESGNTTNVANGIVE